MELNIGSDYAELIAGKYRFYFGYEETVKDPDSPDNGVWAFCAWVSGKEKMRVPFTELDGLGNMQGPTEYLLAGIARYLANK